MGIQKGPFQFTGKLGNVTGRKVGKQFVVQSGSGLTPESRKASEKTRFKRMVENQTEFGAASTLALSIHRQLQINHRKSHQSDAAYQRLTGLLYDLRNTDSNAERGKRRPGIHTLPFLQGFDFNPRSKYKLHPYTLYQATNANNSPPNTLYTDHLPDDLPFPPGANLAALFCYMISLQFDTPKGLVATHTLHEVSFPLPDASGDSPGEYPTLDLPAIHGPGLAIAGIECAQVLNGFRRPFHNLYYNPMAIVGVW